MATKVTDAGDGETGEEFDLQQRILDRIAGGPLRDRNARPELEPWRRLATTIAHYADTVPGPKRLYDAAMGLPDDRHRIGKAISGQNDEVLAELRRFAKPDGDVDDQQTMTAGGLVAQLSESRSGRGRMKDFRATGENAAGRPQGDPRATPPASMVPGPEQEEFRDNVTRAAPGSQGV